MGNNHIIALEREAKLSVDKGRICIYFANQNASHFVACCDIAVLLLGHPQIQLTNPVLESISQAGGVILSVNEKFLPVSLTLPFAQNQQGAKRPHQQATHLYDEAAALWWQQIIRAKIRGQAKTLQQLGSPHEGKLLLLASHVTPADPENREGSAAQLYWPEFFNALGDTMGLREKQGAQDVINVSLNYTYAILRAAVARSLAMSGLCLNFGVGHCRKDNPFNLAEDFIEPFRFLADQVVLNTLQKQLYSEFTPALKKELLQGILGQEVILEGKAYRLFQGIDMAVYSFCVSLEDPRRKLFLPNLPPTRGVKPILPDLPYTHYGG